MSTGGTILETERLILRQISGHDSPALAAYLSDPETMLHYPKPFEPADVDRLIARVAQTYHDYGFGLYAVLLRQSGELIGDCGFIIQEVNGQMETELGYHFARQHWNQGFATEAAAACRDHAFGVLKLNRLISLIRPVNLQSRRVAEKVGLSIESEIVKWNLPHYVYSISRQSLSSD